MDRTLLHRSASPAHRYLQTIVIFPIIPFGALSNSHYEVDPNKDVSAKITARNITTINAHISVFTTRLLAAIYESKKDGSELVGLFAGDGRMLPVDVGNPALTAGYLFTTDVDHYDLTPSQRKGIRGSQFQVVIPWCMVWETYRWHIRGQIYTTEGALDHLFASSFGDRLIVQQAIFDEAGRPVDISGTNELMAPMLALPVLNVPGVQAVRELKPKPQDREDDSLLIVSWRKS